MKTNNTVSGVVAALLLGTLAFSEALAQPHFGRRHMGPDPAMLAEELELTDEQIAQLEDQKFTLHKKAIEIRSKIQLNRLELHKMMRADDPDEGKIKSKIEELGKLETDQHWNRVQGRLNVREVLTEEQQEKLRTLKRTHRRHLGQELRHRRGPGPCRNFHGGLDDFGDEFDFGLQEDRQDI